ncbi:genetic competence negative regulator [Metabacillus fastidiosus]|uniref:genetic competence negative regulator n=1 Tax=Metabacillus fastidiosus TaxID=1458 RepID=UPI003D271AF9
MRLERLNYNKIKVFLTVDDLSDRGLTKEDLWKDSLKVHQLFRDMMEEASEELGFEAHGPIAVEVYSLQAQGMVVIVTKNQETDDEEDDDYSDDYIEMQVKLDESDDIIYEFKTFEDLIQLSKCLFHLNIHDGMIYSYENQYYLLIGENQPMYVEDLISILAEYGHPSTITIHRLEEYGKCLMEEHAIQQLYHFFGKKDGTVL